MLITAITIAILAIFSRIRKKSKTTSQQDIPPNPTPSTPNTWAEILRELGKTEIPAPQPVTTQEQDYETSINPTINKDNTTIEAESSAPELKPKETTVSTNAKNPIKDTEIQKKELKYNLNDPETLRKAVVYAEILNRKY